MSILFSGLYKWKYFFETVRAHGGIKKTLYKMWRFDTFKSGCMVGWDENGNRYYENRRYMIGRCRWVEYADHYKWEYEASQVSPEWYGWLHYMTDDIPCQNCVKVCIRECLVNKRWMLPAEENLTGTEKAYYPYSTTRAFVQPWNGEGRALEHCRQAVEPPGCQS